jgi:general secretion pathway protein D
MVFIRPRILRDGIDAAIETNAKYNYIREQQLTKDKGRVPLMPGEHQPTLPALEKMVPPELLNPAKVIAPPNATPAERAQASGQSSAVAVPVQPVPVPPQATPPPPFTSGTPPGSTTSP